MVARNLFSYKVFFYYRHSRPFAMRQFFTAKCFRGQFARVRIVSSWQPRRINWYAILFRVWLFLKVSAPNVFSSLFLWTKKTLSLKSNFLFVDTLEKIMETSKFVCAYGQLLAYNIVDLSPNFNLLQYISGVYCTSQFWNFFFQPFFPFFRLLSYLITSLALQ